MGGSSISIDVKAANSKIAQMLRKREEDEAVLQIGKARIRDQAAKEADHGGRVKKAKRWAQPADFSYPSPLVDRPKTESGSTSFHFSYTTVSKEGSPTVRGTPVIGFGGAGKTPGADHSKYVEREGAAERSLGAEHAGYIEREGAVELTDVQKEIAEAIERTGDDGVGEGLLPDEKAVLGRVEWEATRSVFSNISDDQFEREEYWRAVHRTEREAKTHSIIVDPSQSPKWWREIETWKDVPDDFRKHCLVQRDRYEAWLSHEAKEPRGKPFVAQPYERTAEGCGTAIQAARDVPGWDVVRAPLRFKSGPGGRVQMRFVAELPHEISPEDRALIVQNFCDHLGSFARDEGGRPVGMMYTAVIHAPDSHNDRRNYHLHVIAHDRPARWMEDHQQWDFEVEEQFNHKGQIRTRHPHRQNKIAEASRKLKDGDPSRHAHFNNNIAGADFIPAMRSKFAEINNKVLAARGFERRLDPRRYEEMGIERTPTEHLGTKAAAMEAMGVPTVVGRLNAIAIWTDAERAIRKRAVAMEANLKATQRDLREFVEDAMSADPRSPETRRLRTLVSERETLVEHIADDRLELMIFDHLEAKAKSRAVRTRQTCLQTLSEADRIPGIHSRETIRAVRKRYEEAQSHIERVNRELAPDRPKLDAAAKDVLAREERIRDIDALLAPIRAALMQAVERERAKGDRRRDRRGRDARVDAPSTERPTQDPAIVVTPVVTPARDTTTPPITTASPIVNTEAKTNTKENINARTRRPDAASILLAGRLFVTPRQLADDGARDLRSAPALSGLRGLSRSPLVRDAARPPVLLQHLQDGLLGRRGVRSEQGPGDGVRRSRTRDQADDRGAGEGRERGLTPATPDIVPVPPVLAPPSVQGVPIIEPTLPVGRDAITPVGSDGPTVPEGLSPVRATPAITSPAAPTEAVEIQLDPTPREDVPADGSPSVAGGPDGADESASPASDTAQPAVPTEGPSAQPEKADGRRRVGDPTLFPVEESIAPTKPGTSKATYEEWDSLVNEIARERIQIVKDHDDRGKVRYDVPSLSEEDRATLYAERFAKRTPGRLAALHDQQAREIDRLVRWIAKNGRDPSKLAIDGRVAKLADAPESVRSLMRDWRSHPRVTQALRSESDRRQQASADALRAEARRREEEARRPAPQHNAASASASSKARLAALAAMYPEADDAATPQVRLLIELLRKDAPATEIQAAAEEVAADPIAREDVHRHKVELAQAYNTAMEDDFTRLLRGQGRRGGR